MRSHWLPLTSQLGWHHQISAPFRRMRRVRRERSILCGSQLRFTKEHAAEGRLTRASWNTSPNPIIKITTPTADNQRSSFDTPVIRPRNPRLDDRSRESLKTVHIPQKSQEYHYCSPQRITKSHRSTSKIERIKKRLYRKRSATMTVTMNTL